MNISIMGHTPVISENVFIAPNATIIGNVTLGKNSNIWFNSVLRGDINSIEIGEGVNIQDGSTIHVDHGFPVKIGKGTTVGHNVIIHAAEIEEFCLIGMGSIILDGAKIGKNSLIAAGAVVTPGTIIPEGSVVMGSPGKIKRKTTEEEIKHFRNSMNNYINYAKSYLETLEGN